MEEAIWRNGAVGGPQVEQLREENAKRMCPVVDLSLVLAGQERSAKDGLICT